MHALMVYPGHLSLQGAAADWVNRKLQLSVREGPSLPARVGKYSMLGKSHYRSMPTSARRPGKRLADLTPKRGINAVMIGQDRGQSGTLSLGSLEPVQ